MTETTQHIARITLDDALVTRSKPAFEHERQVALQDIVEWNHFDIKNTQGPYDIVLSVNENRVVLLVSSATLSPFSITVALAPLRSIIKDYFMISESYTAAVQNGNISRIEAIDMSRRALHNEGSEILMSALEDKVTLDSETARRLFTLICVLHVR